MIVWPPGPPWVGKKFCLIEDYKIVNVDVETHMLFTNIHK